MGGVRGCWPAGRPELVTPISTPRRRITLTRSRRAGALGLSLAAALCGAAAGPQGRPALAASAGVVDQSYRAEGYVPPVASSSAGARFYLTGTATDDLARRAGQPTATFSPTAPSGAVAIQQKPVGVVNDNPDSPHAAYWTGPFSGTIDGPVRFQWWWGTAAAPIRTVPVTIDVFADVGTPGVRSIGTLSTSLEVGPAPVQNATTVTVRGSVLENLRIRVQPRFVDSAADIRVYYGAADSPSSFEVPVGRTAPVKPSTRPLAVRNPLRLQAADIGRDAFEPTIGVTAEGAAFMAATARDGPAQQVPGAGYQTEVMRSVDGGATWASVQPTAPVIGRTPPETVDPYLHVDPTTGRVFSVDLIHLGCSYVIFSDDRGETWTNAPASCAVALNDHQSLVTGPPPEGVATVGYPNVVYFCFNQLIAAGCARSLDGGSTWLPAGESPFHGVDGTEFCSALHGQLATDRSGRVFIPRSQCGRVVLAVSEDAAQTWQIHEVTSLMRAADSQLAVAVDDAENVYFTWWDAVEHLPYMAVSRDHGKTWGPPLLIAPPGLREANFPAIAATGEGRVAISFPGSDDATSPPSIRRWNLYITTSLNALDPRPTFTSTTANPRSNPIHRGDCYGRCAAMADFLDIMIAPSGQIWATATDTCVQPECVRASEAVESVANDARGIAIRQLSGPGLKTRPAPYARPLPSTGTATSPTLLGLLVLISAGALWRHRAEARSG